MRLINTLILLALLMVTGCKTRQFTSIKADKSEWEPVEMEWSTSQPFNWNALEIRMDVEIIQRSGSNNLKARIRFMKDSLGFVQIKPSVGIVDVARLVFTPDSSFLVDLINNRAFGGATSELPLDLPQLQSLLIGVPVLLDSINSYKVWKNESGQYACASQEALAMLSQPMLLIPGQVVLMNSRRETTGQIAGFPEQNIRVDWQALELSEENNPGKYPVKGMIRLRNSGETTEIRYQITKLEVDHFSSLSYSIPPRLTLEPFNQVGK